MDLLGPMGHSLQGVLGRGFKDTWRTYTHTCDFQINRQPAQKKAPLSTKTPKATLLLTQRPQLHYCFHKDSSQPIASTKTAATLLLHTKTYTTVVLTQRQQLCSHKDSSFAHTKTAALLTQRPAALLTQRQQLCSHKDSSYTIAHTKTSSQHYCSVFV